RPRTRHRRLFPTGRVRSRRGCSAPQKAEVAAVLRQWHDQTDEDHLGDIDNHQGNTKWLKVKLGDVALAFHADTRRDAVAQYLEQVRVQGPDFPWRVVPTRTGRCVKVSIEPDG